MLSIWKKTVLALAVVALPLAPATAGAGGPKHCPPGHAKKGWCGGGGGGGEARAYREGYRDGRRDAWHAGDYLPRERYVVVEDYRSYGYPPPPRGRAYVRVDDRIFLVALGTGLIIEALSR